MSNNNGKDKKKKQNDKQSSKTSSASSQSQSRVLPPVLAAYLASSPVIAAPPTLNRSSSLSSTISTISSNASSGGINSHPSRKKSTGHRFMRTFGFGGNRNNNIQQNIINNGESSDLLNVANNNQNKDSIENNRLLFKRTNDTITITVPSQPLITPSQPLTPFVLEPTELLEIKEMEIQSDGKSEEDELTSSSERKDVNVPASVFINNNVKDLNKIDVNEYAEVRKNVNGNVQSKSGNGMTIDSKLIPEEVDSEFQTLIYIIESKSKSQLGPETTLIPQSEEKNSKVVNVAVNTEENTNINATFEESPMDESADAIYEENIQNKNEDEDEDEIVKVKETFNGNDNYKENVDLENVVNTIMDANAIIDDNIESSNVPNKSLATVSEDSMLATSNSTSTCTSTTHTTTTSATDTPLSSRASSSPSTPHPHPPPSTPTNGLVLTHSSLSNASFPSSAPSTPHFSPPLLSQSIPPSPSTLYFPAEISLSLSPETSRPETPEFSHDISNDLSAPPTPQLVAQTLSEIDSDSSLLLVPLSSPSSETPLHTSIPSTPQFSPSAQNSRPSTPQLNSPTLFEEIRQVSPQLAANLRFPPHTLYEELIQYLPRARSSPSSFQDSKPPTPQVSPPISPSLLPPLSLSISPSTSQFPVSAQSSSHTLLTEKLPSPTTAASNFSKISTSLSIQTVTSTTTSPIQSPTNTLRSSSNPPRSPLMRSTSVRSTPPPLPLPPTWPNLKKTKLELKKDELELEVVKLASQDSRTTKLSEEKQDANSASDDSGRSFAEYNARIDLEQQTTASESLKIISSENTSKVKKEVLKKVLTINDSYKNLYAEKPFIDSPTKNNEFLMDIKSTSSTNDVPVARNESEFWHYL